MSKSKRIGAPARPIEELPPIGKLLRGIRGETPIEEAAAELGKSRDWWHRREVGGAALTVDELLQIAKTFGVAGSWSAKGLTIETKPHK